MESNDPRTKKLLLKNLEEQVLKLQKQLTDMGAPSPSDAPLSIRIKETQENFKRIRDPQGPDTGIGTFLLFLEITPRNESVYIPLSVASGKKPTGFIYQIEGTKKGEIVTAGVTVKGTGVEEVTLGTITYARVPAGTGALFRVTIEIKGFMQNSYRVQITNINYKLNPSDARYKKLETSIASKNLKMG